MAGAAGDIMLNPPADASTRPKDDMIYALFGFKIRLDGAGPAEFS